MKYLTLIKDYLEGKKTYIVAVVGAAYGVLTAFEVVSFTAEQEMAIIALLVALFGIAIRASITKING